MKIYPLIVPMAQHRVVTTFRHRGPREAQQEPARIDPAVENLPGIDLDGPGASPAALRRRRPAGASCLRAKPSGPRAGGIEGIEDRPVDRFGALDPAGVLAPLFHAVVAVGEPGPLGVPRGGRIRNDAEMGGHPGQQGAREVVVAQEEAENLTKSRACPA